MSTTINGCVTKNGLLRLGTKATATGKPTPITAIASGPSVAVDGVPQQMYGPIAFTNSKDTPLAFYGFPAATTITADSVVTFSLTPGSITTAAGPCGQIDNAEADNDYGQLERVFGDVSGFDSKPSTMKLGINVGYQNMLSYFPYSLTRNARYRIPANFALTYDANLQPMTVRPKYTFGMMFFNTAAGNGVETSLPGQVGMPSPVGVYSLVFEDVNANNANAIIFALAGDPNTSTGTDTQGSGPGKNPGSTFIRSVNGTTVTLSYWVSYKSMPNLTHGYNLGLIWYGWSPTGNWGANDPTTWTPTITNFWAFTPGDSLTTVYPNYNGPDPNPNGNDRSDPYALSAHFLKWLECGPACVRLMEPLGDYGMNYQCEADVVSMDDWTWGGAAIQTIEVDSVRCFNTNPADPTYAWSSPKIYHPYLRIDGQDPGIGNYPEAGNFVDLSLHGGSTDNGAFVNGPYMTKAVVEFVTKTPHGYRTDDTIFTPTNQTLPVPYWLAMTGGVETNLGPCSVTAGSNQITFATPQTLAAWTMLKFDSSGMAYKVLTSETSQQTYTIFPIFQGTTNAAAIAITTAAAGLYAGNAKIVVTGPNTLVFPLYDLIGVPSTATQSRLNATQPIPMSTLAPFLINATNRMGVMPHGMAGKIAASLNTDMWIPLNGLMSQGLATAIAQKIADQAPAGTTVHGERGLEDWNAGFPTGFTDNCFGNLLAYVPAGKAITPSFTATGAALTPRQAQVVMSDLQHGWMRAAFAETGKSITYKGIFGSFYLAQQVTSQMVGFAKSGAGIKKPIAIDAMVIAPYMGCPTDPTWAAACLVLPVAQLLDIYRHYLKFNESIIAQYAAHFAAIATYYGSPIPVYAYETAIQQIVFADNAALQQDCGNHPEMYNVLTTLYQQLQDNGFTLANHYSLGGYHGGVSAQQLWSLMLYQQQQIGDGSANKFITSQGGAPGDGKCHDIDNVSVQMAAFQAWIAGQK